MTRRLRLNLYLLICLLVAQVSTASAENLSDSLLIYDWQLKSVQSNSAGEPTAGTLTDVFKIQEDGKYELSFASTKLQETGRWQLQGDSIVLFSELIPNGYTIDSIYYKAENNQANLILFHQGKEVARQSVNGLESERYVRKYHVSFNQIGNPTLTNSKETFVLGGKVKLTQEGFTLMDIFRGLIGILGLLAIAWVFSGNRSAINWRLVGIGMGLQFLLAILVLKVPGVKDVFEIFAGIFVQILAFTQAGAAFLFDGIITDTTTFGYIFAFQVLPTIVFFSALMSILYYLGLIQRVVYGFAWVMKRTMGLSGAESLAAAGNIFMGQTEAPLLVKPYLEQMTRSEMMALMTGGMATIAGGVFAAYVGYLGGTDPVQQQIFATHLLTASIMSAPAALVAAKILVPETEDFNQELNVPKDRIGSNLLDAISNGTTDGLKLAVNVGVMLLVFLSLVKMVNYFLADQIGAITGLNEIVADATDGRYAGFNLQFIFGLLLSPIAWLLGVPTEDIMIIGQLLGEKTIVNEFVAYASLGTLKDAGMIVHYKSLIIATYALCGFANFASIGIQIGGIGALAPGQRKTLSELGIKSLIGGTIAAFLTAAMAGMLVNI